MRALQVALLICCSTTLLAQQIRTLAGSTSGGGYADGQGTSARFSGPTNGAFCDGSLFVTDTGNHSIRRISAEGVVSTWAGALTEEGAADGDRAAARFRLPKGIAADGQCNLFVADAGNNSIRRISTSGQVTTVASGFNDPHDLAVDGAGRLWVADTGNKTVRLVSPNGAVTTLRTMKDPRGITIDADGNGVVADFGVGGSLVRITPSGQATTISGGTGAYTDVTYSGGKAYAIDFYESVLVRVEDNGSVVTIAGTRNQPGHEDGSGASVRFSQPTGIVAGPDGALLVVERMNSVVRRVSPSGEVTTWAGSAPAHAHVDGIGTAARFKSISDLDVDSEGVVYVASSTCIRRIGRGGVTTTLAGSPTLREHRDGSGSEARFVGITGLAVAPSGDLVVSDEQTIRRVTRGGVVTTIAGDPARSGLVDGDGAAARFYYPFSVGVAQDETIYVLDAINKAVRKIVGTTVTTLFRDSTLGVPMDLEMGADGDIYFWDENVPSIFRVTPAGVKSIVATDAAMLYGYSGLAVSADGTFFVGGTASRSHAIRRLLPGGTTFTTFAGSVQSLGNQNGEPNAARFTSPSTLTVAPDGRLFIGDSNGAIRYLTNGQPPSIALFSASPDSIQPSEAVTLSWSSSGATHVRIEPGLGEVAASGTMTVHPISSTTFTLIAWNDAGDAASTAFVAVPRGRVRSVRH